ncbi:uncharacterized protein LOC143293387 isoform X1 [Babylonia areolata]|uniref:uncharacterized protein LOC143293387 isoform X1 n=1 Tax=Babylonia areolata TaxID=304850 RepID=UPI003FD63E54
MEQNRPSTSVYERPVVSQTDPDVSSVAGDTEETVGPDGVPGYGQVQTLVQLLLPLRTKTAISNTAAQEIVQAYSGLNDYDKRPLQMLERYQAKIRGRFKAKGQTVSPGLVATRRCHLSSNQGPAARVDSNRLLESLVRELCLLHPSPVTVEGKRTERWAFILKDYARIRNLVLNNPLVMDNTCLQLPDINQATVRDWVNKQAKEQEKQVLQHGLPYQPPALTANEPLPPALPLASTLDVGGEEDRHTYHLPESTAGSAPTVRQRAAPVPIPVTFMQLPDTGAGTAQPQAFLVLSGVQTDTAGVPTIFQPVTAVPSQPVPKTTNWYRKKQQARQEAGENVRINKRHTPMYTCGKCKKPRLKEVAEELAHTQVSGAWWCREVDVIPVEQWKAQRKASLAARKRTQPSATATSTDPVTTTSTDPVATTSTDPVTTTH